MRYTVTASKEFENKYGFMSEEVVKQKDAFNQDQAVKLAEEIFNEGGYSSIYISYAHHDSSCYLNPRIGMEPVGKNWVREFE